MRIINPNVEILEQLPGIEGIYKQIEKAGRTCYKSEDNITDDSAKKFVDRMINSDHLSMLEHGSVYLMFDIIYNHAFDDNIENINKHYIYNFYKHNKYTVVNREILSPNEDIVRYFITTNYRVIIENQLLDDLKYLCEPTEYHTKRYTVKLTTNIGVTREANRHRQSIAEESTRYCNYNKDKFGNDISIVLPDWIDPKELEDMEAFSEDKYNMANISYFAQHYDIVPKYDTPETIYFAAIAFSNLCYKWLIEKGWTPQQAREVLPLATKSDVVYTKSEDEWKHFFDLRLLGTTGKPHPNMQHCAALIINEFYNNNIYIPNYEVYHYYASNLK